MTIAATLDHSNSTERIPLIDKFLFGFVGIFLFLIGDVAIRNNDFWLHLASGRSLSEGGSLGSDPFSFSESSNWINHSWLFDFLLYQFHQTFGPNSLVYFKSTLVVVIALTLVFAMGFNWFSITCLGIGFVAASPRIQMN